jgi:ribosomal protein S18 acetylase RimI-like enzyme
MNDRELVARIQAHRRAWHGRGGGATSVPPFAVFPGAGPDAARIAWAAPDETLASATKASVDAACAALRARRPAPRVEFLDAVAPGLPGSLLSAGFRETARKAVMACRAEDRRPTPAIDGLSVVVLDDRADLADVRANLGVNERGFDPAWADEIPDGLAASFRASLATARAVTAVLDSIPVAAGMVGPAAHGVAELAGLATLPPYRRRGIGAALTAEATRAAVALGAEAVFLVADDAEAGRVYARSGFRPVAALLRYEADPLA